MQLRWIIALKFRPPKQICVEQLPAKSASCDFRAHGHARGYLLSADCGCGRGYVPVADSGHGRGFQHADADICRHYPRGYYPLPSLIGDRVSV
jgi:hypothetical protein